MIKKKEKLRQGNRKETRKGKKKKKTDKGAVKTGGGIHSQS